MSSMIVVVFFFFFKQKTAYEMRISDWSSDVCSSDLVGQFALIGCHAGGGVALHMFDRGEALPRREQDVFRGDVVLPVHERLGPRLRHRHWRRANISAATVAMEDEGRRAGRLRFRGEASCPGRGPPSIHSAGPPPRQCAT